jgi:hypothetical protein
MNKTDKIIFGLILGTFFPFLFALIGIGVGFYLSKEHGIPYFFAAGIIAGIIADLFLLKRILANLFDLNYWLLVGFYILCNIFIYGAFMGFPVCNLVMGLVIGFYSGRRITVKNIISPEREILIKKASVFSALIMLIICISSAYLALHEKTIAEELQGMLGLKFVPSNGLIIGGIISGGIALIILQYLITLTVQIKTLKINSD